MSRNLKKIIILIMVVSLALGVFTVGAFASFLGTGAEKVASDVTLIKTGLVGQEMKFSPTDFKTALGISQFGKITVITLPSSEEGVLMISGKRVAEGQTIKRKNIESLSFIPKDESVTESSFTFKIDGTSEEPISCTMKFVNKVNYAPKVNTDASNSLSVTTQKGISVYGVFNASDPEDDDIDYIIVSYPKYGTLTLTDTENGEFKYTPNNNFSGKDSFVFVVRDEFGNYSSAQTVSIKIIERMSEVVYVDMKDSKNYNAALAMTAMGIMSGTRVGDDMYFSPEGTVTRAEFVAMAMKSLSIKADSTLKTTFFDDNDKIPKSLVSYVATAAKCGIINGAFDGTALNFRPNDAITRYEAAIVMANLLNVKAESQVFSSIEGIGDVPVWARAKVGAMYEIGVFSENETHDMNSALDRESAAEYLYKLANMK